MQLRDAVYYFAMSWLSLIQELKKLLMKVKEGSENAGWKLNIQKTKIMASGPITLWQIDGEKVETVRDFIFLDSKINADGDLQPWNLKMLAPWKKGYDQPRQHIKNQRHYFADKGPTSQSYGFPAVMYRYESWTIKKAEHRRIDDFELWFWRRLLRVLWTARSSNCSTLKEISP